jgi:hypothetical protein
LYWKDGMEATSTLIKRYVFGVVTCWIFLPDVILWKKLENPAIPKTYLFMGVAVVAMSSLPIWPLIYQKHHTSFIII